MLEGRHFLALDQAVGQIGYAIGSPDMVEPILGTYSPPRSGVRYGVMLGAVRDWLDGLIKEHRVFKVCFETPFAGRNPRAYGVVNRMIGVIELVSEDHQITCVEVSPPEWRKAFFGASQAPRSMPRNQRRAWLKGQAMGACTDRKWHINNDDEAEAAGILNYVLTLDSESYRKRDWDGNAPHP